VQRATRLALDTQPCDAVVVLGHAADAVFAEVATMAIRRIDCADWPRGMGASLRAGIAALDAACLGVLVMVCDQPYLDAPHLRTLRDAWRRTPARGAASLYASKLGVPALLPRAWFDVLDAQSDRGMRDLLAQRAERIEAVVDEALAFDIDHPDDLRALR